MKLSISQAAKMAGVSRSHFYKSYINNHRISVEEDRFGKKVIDKSEILRVFGKIHEEKQEDKEYSPNKHISKHEETPSAILEKENLMLRQEINFLKSQLEVSQEREKWFQTQITNITLSLKFLEDKRPKRKFWFLP
jgi:hypothetical protein